MSQMLLIFAISVGNAKQIVDKFRHEMSTELTSIKAYILVLFSFSFTFSLLIRLFFVVLNIPL